MDTDISSTQSTVSVSPSSSTELDTSYGSTSTMVAKQPGEKINSTPVGSLSTGYNTETLKDETLQPSFDMGPSSSSQYAMQHATQAMPSNNVSMATTSYTSEEPSVNQNIQPSSKPVDIGKTVSSKPSTSADTSSLVSIATDSVSVPKSVHPTISGDGIASKDLQDSSSTAKSVSIHDSVTSKYEPSVSDTVSATSHQPAGQAVSVSLTSSMTVSSLSSGSSAKQPLVTPDYSATSRDLYHTMTPSKTEFSPSVLDSMSFKTTPVASLTLTPTVKPGTTSSGDSTPLFGGGTNDLLLYVAVPLCGVGLLVFLIICIVCIKRRKAKQKGSPGRHPVPDLWVNANAEVSLTPLDQRRDIGLTDREALGGQRLSAVRKRYKSKVKENTDHMICSSQAGKCHMTSKGQKEAVGGLIVTDIQGKDVCLIDDGTDDGGDVNTDDGGDVTKDDNDNKLTTDDSTGGCVTYEAMYDFPGELETHLTLRRGDVVQVHRKEDNGWWRGTVGDKTGWFPNGYVQAVLHDYLAEENEVAPPGGELNLSSFMVKRQSGANRHSLPTEDEIQAEPIYCKIQPKNRRKSEPKLDDKSPYKHAPQVARENTPIPIAEGTKFVALYDYTAQLKGELTLEKGDILLGKEKDRNGWMHGVKETNRQEGWFPAVYVDEIVEKEDKPHPEEDETRTKAEPDPAAYQHLEVNTKQGNDQDWVGILHKAVHTFTGEKAGDLHFNSGDMVTVFQVLENGWWLGCKDDVVGWFPGSYVEMVGHQSPKPKDEEPALLSNQPENENITNSECQKPDNPGSSGKIKPVRKAPAPPDTSVNPPPESKIPKIARPNRKAPPPPAATDKSPIKDKTDQDHDIIHDPLYDVIGKKASPSDIVTHGQKDSVKADIENMSETPVRPKREKPKVPLRYVKPKIVTVPRNSVNLSDFHFEKEPSRSKISRPQAPPPPIPSPPKLISQDKSPANQNKDTLEHSISENEESDSFFNISPQKLFDAALKRQDSSDLDETQPYKSLSSFGSTFGKKESVSSSTFHDGVSKAPADKKPTGIPKLSRQAVIEDEVSPTRNVIVHEELNNKEQLDKENEGIMSSDLDKVKTETKGITDSPSKDDSITKEFEIIQTPEKETEDKINKDYSQESSDVYISDNQTNNNSTTKSALPVSRIPRTPGGDNVSKMPMSHGAKKKPETVEDMSHDSAIGNENSDTSISKHSDDTMHVEHKLENSPQKHEHLDKAEKIATAIDGDISDTDRPRANSMEKPPVAPKPKPTGLPKVLPKPKSSGIPQKKGPEDNVHDELHHVPKDSLDREKDLNKSPSPEAVQNQPNLAEPTKIEPAKVSKIPHGSKIAQKSPALKGKTSKIPASPKVGRKNEEAKDKVVSPSETDTENKTQSVNLKQKPESPGMGRKIPRHRTFSNESPSIRNRSNSPHSRTGIPSPAVRNRSNSPATKPTKPSGIKSPSGSGIPSLGSKSSGLPKKQIKQDSVEKSEPSSPVTAKTVNDITDAQSSDELESGDNKPNRPSKPPRVQKQKSAESKPPKQGKSLLPVIHKSMDSGSPTAGKAKTGIPMAKPPRPPQPKSPGQHHQDNGVANKKTLYQAVKGYTAQCDGELTFSEGTFIKELSDCDRAGWYVGMLADGTTGIYPADHLKPSPVTAQSEA